MVLAARLVRLAALVVCAIIALAAIFILLDANAGNWVVSHVRDWGKTLAGPFDGIFHLDSAKGTVALNYGIAIIVYAIVAGLIVRLLAATTVGSGRRRVVT
jgi:hypothetical protein